MKPIIPSYDLSGNTTPDTVTIKKCKLKKNKGLQLRSFQVGDLDEDQMESVHSGEGEEEKNEMMDNINKRVQEITISSVDIITPNFKQPPLNTAQVTDKKMINWNKNMVKGMLFRMPSNRIEKKVGSMNQSISNISTIRKDIEPSMRDSTHDYKMIFNEQARHITDGTRIRETPSIRLTATFVEQM